MYSKTGTWPFPVPRVARSGRLGGTLARAAAGPPPASSPPPLPLASPRWRRLPPPKWWLGGIPRWTRVACVSPPSAPTGRRWAMAAGEWWRRWEVRPVAAVTPGAAGDGGGYQGLIWAQMGLAGRGRPRWFSAAMCPGAARSCRAAVRAGSTVRPPFARASRRRGGRRDGGPGTAAFVFATTGYGAALVCGVVVEAWCGQPV